MVFGGWAIDEVLFNKIREMLLTGSTILELGSGEGTAELAKFYTVYSVEHSGAWIGKHGSNYIHAPIVDGWYDVEVLKKSLPEHYDLILVDGPPQRIGRKGFVDNLDLFDLSAPIILDDYYPDAESGEMCRFLAGLLGYEVQIYDGSEKQFAVLASLPNNY